MTPITQSMLPLTKKVGYFHTRAEGWFCTVGLGMVLILAYLVPCMLVTERHENLARESNPTYEDRIALEERREAPLPKEGRDWVEAMAEIAYRESRFNPRMQNSTSTSSGLFGFLDSTYKNYGGKTKDPMEQTRKALRYTQDRYGSPVEALDFHRRNGWY